MILSASQKENFRLALSKLGIRQNAFAEEFNITASVLSEALNPKKEKPVNDATWVTMQEGLRILVKKAREDSATAVVDCDAVDTLIRAIVADSPVANNGRPILQEPGGFIHATAANYILRPADAVLDRQLEGAIAPVILVSGGVQCGRSSLVNRLIFQARQRKMWVRGVDFALLLEQVATGLRPALNIHEAFRFLWQGLEFPEPEDMDAVKGAELAHSMGAHFAAEAERRLHNEARWFVVLDGLDRVLAEMPSEEGAPLLAWISALRNRANHLPLNRMTLIATHSALPTLSVAVASSSLMQATRVATTKFTESQITQLCAYLQIADDESAVAACAIDHFAGHPYLSHLFLIDLANGFSLAEAQANARNHEGAYGTHWQRILYEVNTYCSRVAGKTVDAPAFIRQTLARVDGSFPVKGATHGEDILKELGVLDKRDGTFITCSFYRTAIEAM